MNRKKLEKLAESWGMSLVGVEESFGAAHVKVEGASIVFESARFDRFVEEATAKRPLGVIYTFAFSVRRA